MGVNLWLSFDSSRAWALPRITELDVIEGDKYKTCFYSSFWKIRKSFFTCLESKEWVAVIPFCPYHFMHQHIWHAHLPLHWLCITSTQRRENKIFCVTSEQNDKTTKPWQIGFCTRHLIRRLTRLSLTLMRQVRCQMVKTGYSLFSV